MPTQRAFDPEKLGVLSCLPLEVRQIIYDHMCRLDSPAYEFEVEGPNNLHIPAATVDSFQDPKVPRIAHVCTEMRDYALGPALSPIEFTYYVFRVEPSQSQELRREWLLERRTVKSLFRFQSDTLAFKPHEMPAVEEFDLGEGDDYDFILWNYVTLRRLRVFMFPGSGGLPSSYPEGWSHFEEFVRARRDDYVAKHPEAATVQITTLDEVGVYPRPELIEQTGYLSVQRSYNLARLQALMATGVSQT